MLCTALLLSAASALSREICRFAAGTLESQQALRLLSEQQQVCRYASAYLLPGQCFAFNK